MKALVIDDELLARKRIVNLLEEIEEIELTGECSNGKSSISKINELKPDLIFLDINMKDMTGFEVLKQIKISPRPIVIFVTAHQRHAIKAFDYEAFDFLLKPYKDERFFKTVNKALGTSKRDVDSDFEKKLEELLAVFAHYQSEKVTFQKIPIRQGNKTFLLEANKINYIIASGYYAEIYSDSKKYLIRESLANLENNLNSAIFFRVHRSAIVNINFIKEIAHSDYSEIDVKMEDNKLIRVSKSKKKAFLDKIGL